MRDSSDLWMVILYGIFASLCSLVVPVAVQTFVNTLGFGLLLQPILILAAIVFFVLSFSSIVNILQVYVMELLQQRWFSGVALELAQRLTRVQLEALRRFHGSDLATYFLEIATIQKTLSVLLLDTVAASLQILFGMFLLALYHPYFLVFDLLIIAFIGFVFFGLRKPAIDSSLKESKAKYETTSWLGELARNSILFRSAESRRFAMARVDDLASNYVLYRKKHFKILLKQIGGSALLQILMSSLLLGAGGWLVIERQLSLGQLVAAELVFGTVVAGISKFGKYLESYYDLHAAIDKIGQVLNLPDEIDGREQSEQSAGGKSLLQVKKVSYKSDFGVSVFSDLTFDVHPGTVTVVVGKNGSGKSTLAEFLYGVRNPSSGVIHVNGLDLRYSDKEKLRSQISFVGQADLMTGTILENIRMGRDDVSLDQVQRVIKGLGLSEFVDSLPQGLMSRVSGGRFPLSSGQAQKVLIARALVARPQILILDETLDHLDSESYRLVAEFLRTRESSGAVVLTTRNAELAGTFDQTIFLPEGRVVSKKHASQPSVLVHQDGGVVDE